MSKHTPGPWRWFADDDSCDVMTEDGAHIARVEPVNSCHPEDEQDANARLIAAAPDMLEALQMLRSLAQGEIKRPLTQRRGFAAFDRAWRAAIAKAEGK